MAIYEDYYVINSTSHIKSVPTFLCSELDTSVTYCGKPCIKATLPTCFIEIEYKSSDGHYLITKEVFLYEEDYPSMEALEAYKDATSYGFASQVTEQINDLVDCHHNSQGCMCLSYGDY